MRKVIIGAAGFLALALGVTALAGAYGQEKVGIVYGAKAQKGKLSPKKFSPVNLKFGITVNADTDTILPLTNVKMKFPTSKAFKFVPPKGMPVCPDSAVSKANDGLTVDQMYAACPKSYIGTGTASFSFGKKNIETATRTGAVVVLYGGKVGGNVKLKFPAYSADTQAGVYAEGILKPNGTMDIAMPVLTNDSAVRSLQLEIPGRNITAPWSTTGTKFKLKKGLAPKFAQSKCKAGSKLTFSAVATLQQRNEQTEQPFGDKVTRSPKKNTKCGK